MTPLVAHLNNKLRDEELARANRERDDRRPRERKETPADEDIGRKGQLRRPRHEGSRRLMTISAHIIDWANGIAAAGVRVRLERYAHAGWAHVGSGTTGSRGRITDWLAEATAPAPACVYRMIIDTSAYFASLGAAPLYHDITITFAVRGRIGRLYGLPGTRRRA